jgi:hypothetical protein
MKTANQYECKDKVFSKKQTNGKNFAVCFLMNKKIKPFVTVV